MSYPRTIEDGGGERLTFVARRRDEHGELLEVRNAVAPGAGPPMHVHHLQEESLTVEHVCTGYARPPHKLEYFLSELSASTRRHGGKRPGLLDAAWLSHRYRDEFATLEVPAPVRRLVFPVLARVGGALGLRRRFAGAPEPVRA